MARGRAGCAANCSEPHRNKLVGAEKEKGTMGTGRKLVGSMERAALKAVRWKAEVGENMGENK